MRSFLVLATLAFVAVQVSQVYSDSSSSSDSSDSSDSHGYGSSLSHMLFGGGNGHHHGHHGHHGHNMRDLSYRRRLIVRMEQYPVWDSLSVIRQQRLINAIMRNYSVPSSWSVSNWTDLLEGSYASRLQEIMNQQSVLESLIDDLPHGPNESLVLLAQRQSWWSSLATWQQRIIAMNILRNQNIPLGYSSWSDALNSGMLSSGVSTISITTL